MNITESPDTLQQGSIQDSPATAHTTGQAKGWSFGRRVRQIPQYLGQELIDRLSMRNFSLLCLIVIPTVCLSISSRLITRVEDGRYSSNHLLDYFIKTAQVIFAYKLGNYVYNRLQEQAVRLLDTGPALTIPHQVIDSVIKGARCPEHVGKRIKEMLGNNELSPRHFKQLCDLYLEILNNKHLCSGVERNKVRATLEILTRQPHSLYVISTQVINEIGLRCNDNLLNILDRTYYMAVVTASRHRMEQETTPDWGEWLNELRKMYHEYCFNETLRLTSSDPKRPLTGKNSLLQHHQSAAVHNVYKKILHEAGTCDFMTVPSKIDHSATVCCLFLPSSTVFYEFEREMQKRVADSESFREFVHRAISELKGSVSEKDRELASKLEDNSHFHFQELGILEEEQAKGFMTDQQYNQEMTALMENYNQESDKLWSSHLNSKIDAFLEQPAPHRSRVTPNLSLRQLIRRYNQPPST